eukprot:CAMPEP_0183795886 /NCGR_PEP_ID=MMETSP0803_2-20130417/5377_1 /TAXON_ID=195967 /ORGANISM="Crustomastix stigmata, Strain CCMP3273" /LENGTH=96 /DNA_ID=CAMNT_0026040393 /DNA_START=39 /DNA_END=326 /DNA_ORIENTATION=+
MGDEADAETEADLKNLWDTWLKEYDKDGSKTISLDELKAFGEAEYTGNDTYMKMLKEWVEGAKAGEGGLEGAFKEVDKDGSGELEFEEFKAMLMAE